MRGLVSPPSLAQNTAEAAQPRAVGGGTAGARRRARPARLLTRYGRSWLLPGLRPGGGARRFTLLEVLVAMSILVILGTALMVILRGGLSTWRRSEAKRESYDQAQAIFAALRDDFASALAPPESPLEGLGPVEARLLCEIAPNGRTRLFLVRSLKAETEHPLTGFSGSAIRADREIDQRNDLAEARYGRLRATGGAMEVAWVLDTDGVLYRGIRTPPGEPNSLFAVGGYELAPPLAKRVEGEATPSPAPPARSTDDGPQPAILRPFATEVIHFECVFWSQYTRTWSTKFPASRDPNAGEPSGPLPYWDSTRSMPEFSGSDPDEFHTFKSAASLSDSRDDVYPSRVQVTLVLREPSAARTSTFLDGPVAAGDREIRVEDPGRLPDKGYVYVNKEWIYYDEIRGKSLQVANDPRYPSTTSSGRSNGRGTRNTSAQDHEGSEEIFAGQTFVVVLDVPAWREDLSDGVGRRP